MNDERSPMDLHQAQGRGRESSVAPPRDAAPIGIATKTTTPHVLYVDDDHALCGQVSHGLDRYGIAITPADDAGMAMRLLTSSRYDVVVLDHRLPGHDGLATLARIAREVPDPPPVIFMAHPQQGAAAMAALEAGAIHYVVKTAGQEFLDFLLLAIRQALEQLHLRREKEIAHQAVADANRRLEALVDRQAALLREMNHRIANSLALVGSLVRLQMDAVSDEAARNALADTEHRLAAVMQVHRSLYTSAEVERTDLSAYLRDLLAELERSLMASTIRHRLLLKAVPVVIATDRVIPVGIIVTELLTNALKYAYPTGDEPGDIRILLRREANETMLALTVEDDGVGFQDPGVPTHVGLGQRVIEAMAISLDARVSIDPKHRGARVTVTFPA